MLVALEEVAALGHSYNKGVVTEEQTTEATDIHLWMRPFLHFRNC